MSSAGRLGDSSGGRLFHLLPGSDDCQFKGTPILMEVANPSAPITDFEVSELIK